MCNLMTTETDNIKLIRLLDKAEDLVGQFSGGYSGQFLSAEEFHQALKQAIDKYKNGDTKQIDNFYYWFAPTTCWDDFVGKDGEDLGNETFGLICKIRNL